MSDAQPTVTFTVKEMFLNIQKELQGISAKLDTKADQADVVALQVRVGALETDRAAHGKWTESRRWTVTTLISGASLAAALVAVMVR